MNDKFKGKYRISPARLQSWDYANNGAYFITICTKDRNHFFGKIEEGKMNLSQVGVIADLMWFEIKHHAKNIELGEFIVMPNHIHGILILNGSQENNDDLLLSASTSSNELPKTIGQQRFQHQGNNTISAIVGSYKSAVTKHANRLGFQFVWQPSFHEHIIRDEQSFERIQNYVANNPSNWNKDKFYDVL